MTIIKFERRPYRRCVGITLFNKKGQVFVAQRLDQKENAWQMPQGGMEKTETPSEAAIRELEEEIGTADVKILAESKDWHRYDLPSYLADKIWDGRFRGQTQKWLAMEFLGEDSAIKPSDVDKPEFSEWRWVELEVIPSLAVSFKKEIYQSITDEFAEFAITLRPNNW